MNILISSFIANPPGPGNADIHPCNNQVGNKIQERQFSIMAALFCIKIGFAIRLFNNLLIRFATLIFREITRQFLISGYKKTPITALCPF